MNVHLDLFAGISGFHKGLLQAGIKIKTHYSSETDKHAKAISKYQFKDLIDVGPVENVRDSGIERPNIITFGSPCQDFSIAGKRSGMGGERSSLITYAIELVDRFRPDVFIWENVKGTFSSNDGGDFWAIIQAFANIGGYRLEWQLLNTSWFLPQNRERIYLVGHLADGSGSEVFPIGENNSGFNERSKQAEIAASITGGGNSGGMHSSMNLLSTNLQGNSVVNTIRSGGRGSLSDKHNWDIVCTPVLTPDRPIKRQNGRRFKEPGEDAFTLTAQDKHGVMITNTNMSGKSYQHQHAGSLRANASYNYQTVNNIRRLTEIECERLQGYEDDCTKYGDYDGVIKEVSATQRYKCLGNSVTVDVVEAIGRKLQLNQESL